MSSVNSAEHSKKRQKSFAQKITDNIIPIAATGIAGVTGYNYFFKAPKPQTMMQKALNTIGFGSASGTLAKIGTLAAISTLATPYLMKLWKGTPTPPPPIINKSTMGSITSALSSFGKGTSNAVRQHGVKAAIGTGIVGAGTAAVAFSPLGAPAYALALSSGAQVAGLASQAGAALTGTIGTLSGLGTAAGSTITSGLTSASAALSGLGITATGIGSRAINIISDAGTNILTAIGLSKAASAIAPAVEKAVQEAPKVAETINIERIVEAVSPFGH